MAIVKNDSFHIYDIDSARRRYAFIKSAPTGMSIKYKVRAAFPLPAYGGCNACIVTGDIFEDKNGYATIFHEFVHCYQSENYTQALKRTLLVAKRAQARGDQMWEINHHFPYRNKQFINLFGKFQAALGTGEEQERKIILRIMRSTLKQEDYEYMVWEMWSEGFARLMENRIRARMKLELIGTKAEPPYDRVSFYTVGANYIEYLEKRKQGVLDDLATLFRSMK